jgi:peptidoglycan/LPS O-acetylase OafA/YrhL
VKWTKHYLIVLIGIVIGLVLITNVLYLFADHSGNLSLATRNIKIVTFAYKFFDSLRIGCMAIGGIGAYFLYSLNQRVLRPIFTTYTQLITFVVVMEMMLFGIEIPMINHEVYALFFIIIILNFAANPNCLANLENPFLDYLGKISYSIYMWHGIAIIFGLHAARAYNVQLDDFVSNAIYYLVTFALTLAFSAASYEWFEMRFLKFKHLFAKVQSGNLGSNTEGGKKGNKKDDYKKNSAASY